jgi:hypothetical protein
MKSLIFSCYEKNIQLVINKQIDFTSLNFWVERFTPQVSIGESSANIDYKINCIDFLGEPFYEIVSDNEINLHYDWISSSFGYLGKFVSQAFQKLLSDRSICFLPTACVSKDNRAVLFVGDYWQGKTSIVMELTKINDVDLVSDNCIAIKGFQVLGGTKYLSFRKENRHNKLFTKKNNAEIEINGRNFYESTNNFKEQSNKIRIVGLINAHINNGDDNIHIVPKEEAIWYLYSKFSRLIKGEIVLFDSKIPGPSFDSKERSIRRLNMVKSILDSVELTYMSSSIDRIKEETYKLLSKNHG